MQHSDKKKMLIESPMRFESWPTFWSNGVHLSNRCTGNLYRLLVATNLNLFADLEVDFRVLPGEEAEGLRFAHCIREFCRQDMIFNMVESIMCGGSFCFLLFLNLLDIA